MRSVAIVGGGVIGLAAAVELQRRGLAVTLVEKDAPGEGCSFGNAGVIATSEVLPLVTPARLKALPSMILREAGPAVIRLSAFPGLAGWMLRASRSLTPGRQGAIMEGLAWLNTRALDAWRELLALCDASGLMLERGMLEVFREDVPRAVLDNRAELLARFGLDAERIDARGIESLEPALAATGLHGLMHRGCAHVVDPLSISHALLRRFEGLGGTVLAATARAVLPEGTGACVELDEGRRLQADIVLVAAGMASARLLSGAGLAVPLQAERGYHLMLGQARGLLSRPLIFHRESFAATPMEGGLRLAGTVEFSAPESTPRWKRAEQLSGLAQPYFKAPLPPGDTARWIGSRPSLPDSLPAIGRLSGAPAIAYAFGHQHLGLTQAAITARLVADMLLPAAGQFAPDRFSLDRFQ